MAPSVREKPKGPVRRSDAYLAVVSIQINNNKILQKYNRKKTQYVRGPLRKFFFQINIIYILVSE